MTRDEGRARFAEALASVLPPADVAAALADHDRIDAALDGAECPTCRARLDVQIDPRQAGDTEVRGLWVLYRCRCGFSMDRVDQSP